MSSATINGIELHYQSYGEGETIVFAHGAGGNLLSWWQQVPFFSQRYRCVTFDHRGFGHSLDLPGGPGSGAFVEDLKGLLDHLETVLAGQNPIQVYWSHRNMTQAELATAAGINAIHLSQIETGKRTASTNTLVALAQALNITVDDLL